MDLFGWALVGAVWGWVLANAIALYGPRAEAAVWRMWHRSRLYRWRESRRWRRWYESLTPEERTAYWRRWADETRSFGEAFRGLGISAADATAALHVLLAAYHRSR